MASAMATNSTVHNVGSSLPLHTACCEATSLIATDFRDGMIVSQAWVPPR